MKLFSNGVWYHANIHQSNSNLPFVLMLHGFMGSSEVFSPIISPLKKFCNPITLDLLGHGKTGGSDQPERYHSEYQVSDLISIIQRFCVKNLYLYGYSMGGRLAFQLIVRNEKLFEDVLLESTHCGITDQNERAQRRASDEVNAQDIEENYHVFLDEWMKNPLFSGPGKFEDKRYLTIMKNQQPEFMSASLRGFGAGTMPSVCEDFQQLSLPVCLEAGELDDKYKKRMSELSAKLANVSLKIAANAGHRVHSDQPESIVKTLKNLIEENHGKLENC
ncbi:MAG: alpha/beta fold hydrolase [Balneolaceae bacterium]